MKRVKRRVKRRLSRRLFIYAFIYVSHIKVVFNIKTLESCEIRNININNNYIIRIRPAVQIDF